VTILTVWSCFYPIIPEKVNYAGSLFQRVFYLCTGRKNMYKGWLVSLVSTAKNKSLLLITISKNDMETLLIQCKALHCFSHIVEISKF
jgi:hypothetical protein